LLELVNKRRKLMRPESWTVTNRSVCLLILLIVGGLFMASAASAGKRGEETTDEGSVINEQRRIETMEKWIEIEVRSSRPFPVRALPPVLRIGNREFSRSRHPDDGRLDTLIFRIPLEDFAELTSKDPVTVFYALSPGRKTEEGGWTAAVPDSAGPARSFGTLQKELLDRPAPEADDPQE
jgi:hypothetical protein